MNELGEYLKFLRGKMTLIEAAERIGVSHTYVRDLELGKKKNPSMKALEKIAKAYDVPLDDLIAKAYIKTTIITPEEAKKLIEEDKEMRKNKDILHLLQNKNDNVYYNGKMLTADDRQKVLTVLSALLSEYHKD